MTLKEKFKEILTAFWINVWEDECEKVADEFAIGFAEWLTNEKSEYSILYGNQEKRFATFEEDYTAKELLEIYKKESNL
jgi:hypothetical protein